MILAFARQLADTTALEGKKITFPPAVNDPSSVTSYQWQKKAPGAAAFTDLPGEVNATYTTETLSLAELDSQLRRYKEQPLEKIGPFRRCLLRSRWPCRANACGISSRT